MGKKSKSKANRSAGTSAATSPHNEPAPLPETDDVAREATADGPSISKDTNNLRGDGAADNEADHKTESRAEDAEEHAVQTASNSLVDNPQNEASTSNGPSSHDLKAEVRAMHDTGSSGDGQDEEEHHADDPEAENEAEASYPRSRSASTSRRPSAALDPSERISELEEELETTKIEKEQLGNQYRTLLSKLTGMRQSLGEKLREDAEELDRREAQISQLQADVASLTDTVETLKAELDSSAQESSSLHAQLAQLRASSSSSSSDVLTLTRELRELRGEMERLRIEREEWELEAGRERQKREDMEEEMRHSDRQRSQAEAKRKQAEELLSMERSRADNLQEVLAEFQASKDMEVKQATAEIETQLRQAVTQLSEYKSRVADAESRLTDFRGEAGRSTNLEKELKDKNALIGKLRHEAVVTQEHLTEALRRLRRTSSDTNVDRRLVTNVLLQFLTIPRADPKRFEVLSLLATILSWEDSEREKAGLQRAANSSTSNSKRREQGSGPGQRTAEENDTLNEEAAQGQRTSASPPATTPTTGPARSGFLTGGSPTGSAVGSTLGPTQTFGRSRTYSNTSRSSNISGIVPMYAEARSPPSYLSYGRRPSNFRGGEPANGEGSR